MMSGRRFFQRPYKMLTRASTSQRTLCMITIIAAGAFSYNFRKNHAGFFVCVVVGDCCGRLLWETVVGDCCGRLLWVSLSTTTMVNHHHDEHDGQPATTKNKQQRKHFHYIRLHIVVLKVSLFFFLGHLTHLL